MAFPPGFAPQPIISPSYNIRRDLQPGRPFDASAPLIFYPPKDSDELHDALRLSFPHLNTHSERVRDAVLQFLVEERQAGFGLNESPVASAVPGSSWHSTMARSVSPAMSRGGYSGFDQQMRRSPSHAASPSTSRGKAPVPSQEQMSGVFSLDSTGQAKHHTRRKMTEMEKMEYRKRRIVKACEKCAKRKRKCNHMQDEMARIETALGDQSAQSSQYDMYLQVPPMPHPGTASVAHGTLPVGQSTYSDPFDYANMGWNPTVPALPEPQTFNFTDMSDTPMASEAHSTSGWSADGSPAWMAYPDFDNSNAPSSNPRTHSWNMPCSSPLEDYEPPAPPRFYECSSDAPSAWSPYRDTGRVSWQERMSFLMPHRVPRFAIEDTEDLPRLEPEDVPVPPLQQQAPVRLPRVEPFRRFSPTLLKKAPYHHTTPLPSPGPPPSAAVVHRAHHDASPRQATTCGPCVRSYALSLRWNEVEAPLRIDVQHGPSGRANVVGLCFALFAVLLCSDLWSVQTQLVTR